MRVVIQRVNNSEVLINNKNKRSIGSGLLVLTGIEENDNEGDINWIAKKLVQMRIFNDDNGVMNRSVKEVDGEIMIISQFTLHASTKKGNRPSYIKSAKPDTAIPIYQRFIKKVEEILGKTVQTGEFGAYMVIKLENDGPVTILLDSKIKE